MIEEALQTFYVGLFPQIKNVTIVNPHTKSYYRSEADSAMFYSLLEMTGADHYQYLPEILIGSGEVQSTGEKAEQ